MFEIGSCVRFSQDGKIFSGKILKLHSQSAEVYVYETLESLNVSVSELEFLPPVPLSAEEFRRLARFEIRASEVAGENVSENLVNAENYQVTCEDLLAALRRFIEADISPEEVDTEWFSAVCTSLDEFGEDEFDASNESFWSERQMICRLRDFLYDWVSYHAVWGLEQIVSELELFLEDYEKPTLERRYPLHMKLTYLARYENESILTCASEEEIALYRHFAEGLALEKIPEGLLAVGYGSYGGNRAFPCDWDRSRDCMLALLELEDSRLEKAVYANTLGYIYYYGRCSGGVPDYGLAYKYFSFAAFDGHYEAQYKIADMYRNGYGVFKSIRVAKSIIRKLYDENLKYIQAGLFHSKFADVALRLAGLIRDESESGLGMREEHRLLMQADFAIRMRMLECDAYGDGKVSDSISQALAEVKERMKFKPSEKESFFALQNELEALTKNGRRLCVTAEPLEDGRGHLTFQLLPKAGEAEPPKMFLTLPNLEVCGFYETFSIIFQPVEGMPLKESIFEGPIFVDEIQNEGFFEKGVRVLTLYGQFELPPRKEEAKSEEKFRLAAVLFPEGERTYTYLCEDESIQPGEAVTVQTIRGEMRVTVTRVFEKKESELSLPLKRYKRILGRFQE